MFLGVGCDVGKWDGDSAFSLLFEDNPLNDFVELPSQVRIG